LAFSFLFYAFAPSWEYVLLGIILLNFSTIHNPALSAIIADSIPPDQRGVGYTLRSALPRVASIFAPTIVGLLVTKYGLVAGMRVAYIIVTVLYLIGALIRARYLEETLEKAEPTESFKILSSLKESFASIPDVWRSMPKNFKPLMAATIISGFSGPLFYPFLALYAVDVIGVTSIQWGFLGSIGIAVGLIASYPLGRLVDKIPRKTSVIIAWALWLPTAVLLFVSRNYVFLVLFFVLKAVDEALFATALQGMSADLIPRESRGRIGSVQRTLGNILGTVSYAVGGFLYQSNPAYPFMISLFLDVLSLLLVVFLLKEPERREI
jgi:MFS family permease